MRLAPVQSSSAGEQVCLECCDSSPLSIATLAAQDFGKGLVEGELLAPLTPIFVIQSRSRMSPWEPARCCTTRSHCWWPPAWLQQLCSMAQQTHACAVYPTSLALETSLCLHGIPLQICMQARCLGVP
ncbi:hypothetical protein WJX74_000638 [Apatococcus lobatus]|uniref:Uncharacterized protein n=2 Tax=Apatococcus TaxID=904362 RepID=A0AAW1T1M9_9CHLO